MRHLHFIVVALFILIVIAQPSSAHVTYRKEANHKSEKTKPTKAERKQLSRGKPAEINQKKLKRRRSKSNWIRAVWKWFKITLIVGLAIFGWFLITVSIALAIFFDPYCFLFCILIGLLSNNIIYLLVKSKRLLHDIWIMSFGLALIWFIVYFTEVAYMYVSSIATMFIIYLCGLIIFTIGVLRFAKTLKNYDEL